MIDRVPERLTDYDYDYTYNYDYGLLGLLTQAQASVISDAPIAAVEPETQALAVAASDSQAVSPISGINDPIEVIVQLLTIASDSSFSTQRPQVKRYFDDAPSERGPGAGQPPVVYIFSPTSATIDRHTMDDQQFNQSNTLQVLIMSLDEQAVIQLQSDVVNIISRFLSDNRGTTPFIDVQPTQASDFREQKQSRVTDHFVTRVTVETTNLTDTGL
jgi:hypothetical protein